MNTRTQYRLFALPSTRRSGRTFAPAMLVLITFLGSVWPSTGGDKKTDDDDWKRFKEAVYREADWDLLQFGDESKSGQITKLRIVLYKTGKLPMAEFAERNEEFVYETKDPKDLRLVERFLSTPLRAVAHRGIATISPLDYSLGKVEVTCTKGRFYLSISTYGFNLNSDICVPQNLLFSWGLAKLIDHALVCDTKKHLHAAVIQHLSGEATIDDNRFYFDQAYPQSKNDINGGKPAGSVKTPVKAGEDQRIG